MSDVGPVLEKSDVADAIIAAIRALNAEVRVLDRGAYWRVSVAERCLLTQSAVQSALGRPFVLPDDLEIAMPSFSGRFSVTRETATWE